MYPDFFKAAQPFFGPDAVKVFAEFDPSKITEQFTKTFGDVKMPKVDVEAVVTAQRKNLEAISKANTAAFTGAQEVAQKQADLVKKVMDEATAVAKTMGETKTPQEIVAKQAELTKSAYTQAFANAKVLADTFVKSQDAATKVINARVTEGLDEVKDLVMKTAK